MKPGIPATGLLMLHRPQPLQRKTIHTVEAG